MKKTNRYYNICFRKLNLSFRISFLLPTCQEKLMEESSAKFSFLGKN